MLDQVAKKQVMNDGDYDVFCGILLLWRESLVSGSV